MDPFLQFLRGIVLGSSRVLFIDEVFGSFVLMFFESDEFTGLTESMFFFNTIGEKLSGVPNWTFLDFFDYASDLASFYTFVLELSLLFYGFLKGVSGAF